MQAGSFPLGRINLRIEEEQVTQQGVEVSIRVEIGLADSDQTPAIKKGNIRYGITVVIATSDGHLIE